MQIGIYRYGQLDSNPWVEQKVGNQIKRSWSINNNERNIWTWPSSALDILGKIEKSKTPDIRANIINTSDSYLIEAELPGFSEEQVEIYINENREIVIKAEREEINAENTEYYMQERKLKLERVFKIFEDVDIDNSEAKFEKGILNISLPKIQSEKSRHINIKKS